MNKLNIFTYVKDEVMVLILDGKMVRCCARMNEYLSFLEKNCRFLAALNLIECLNKIN